MRYHLYVNILQYLINGCVIIIMGGQIPEQHQNATGLVGDSGDHKGLTTLMSSVIDDGGGGRSNDDADGNAGDNGSNNRAWLDADRMTTIAVASMNTTMASVHVIDPNEQSIALNADNVPLLNNSYSNRMADERGECC